MYTTATPLLGRSSSVNSSDSRSSTPPPLTPNPNEYVSHYTTGTDGKSSYDYGQRLGGGQSVLDRQAKMLERSSSVTSLARSNSVASIRDSFSSSNLNKDYTSHRTTPSWSRGHKTASSASGNLFGDPKPPYSSSASTPSYRPTSASGYSSSSAFRHDETDSRVSRASSFERNERAPLSSVSNSSNYTTASAPSTPSHRESRFSKFSYASEEPTKSPPRPELKQSYTTPARSSVQSSISSAKYDFPTPTSSGLKRSDSFTNNYSSVVSASNRSHRHTRSVPTLDLQRSTTTSSTVLGLPLNLNGHGTRHGLDRLSEHYDQEEEAYSPAAPISAYSPAPYSPSASSSPYKSPRLRSDLAAMALSLPESPRAFFHSPDLDAQREMHMPGSAKGEVQTHRNGRVVLSRKPTISSSGMVLPSNSARAMDISRHHVAAFEYLSHVAEAQAWLDRELRRDVDYDPTAPEADVTSGGVANFEQALRNGVALAKLARVFDGRKAVPRIYTHPKLSWHHTDNINYFFTFIRKRHLPETYIFETTDLYDANNMPKVIYCIHALSAFLVAQGQAQRMKRVDNLDFSEEQLDKTKRGIDHLVMPNFKSLAKDLKLEPEPEPEPEPETDEERLERLLGEVSFDLYRFPACARGYLARQRFRQARTLHRRINTWATKLQSVCLRSMARTQLQEKRGDRRTAHRVLPGFQAHAKAALQRRSYHALQDELRWQSRTTIATQATARGVLVRRKFWKSIKALDQHDQSMTNFQARLRGALVRRSQQQLSGNMQTATRSITQVQTAARRILAERALLERVRSLRSITPQVVGLQAAARGVLARREAAHVQTIAPQVVGFQAAARGLISRRNAARTRVQLEHVSTAQSIASVQSLARAALVRKKLQQQSKELNYVSPDVVGMQAQIRGILARDYYYAWLHHLQNNAGAATFVQSLMRGHLARLRFWKMLGHYHNHMEKVVKVQAIFRRKQQAQQYNQLTMGQNVPIGTVKNFLHLLQDSDYDYAEEIRVEQLRKDVVKAIRDNQEIEVEVNELDTKIALLVKNKITLDEVLRTRKAVFAAGRPGQQTQGQSSILSANKDPFALSNLDKGTRQKLELYQELFYILQTQPEYLARLFHRLSKIEFSEKDRKDIERIVLTLFGYAQNAREEFLLLKLFQRSLHEEILSVDVLQDFIRTDYLFIKLVVQYGRGAKERKYFKDMLAPHVQAIVSDESIDLETDPVVIYKATIADEEMRTGLASPRPRDVDGRQALGDDVTRNTFIRHLQHLRALTDTFLQAIVQSTSRMPFGIRWIAREMYTALQAKFRNEPQEALIRVVCHFVYYRYINPAIVAPESFGVLDLVIAPAQRRALAEVSKMLNQISAGRLFDAKKDPTLEPLNHYITKASQIFSSWLFDVINVSDAETYFNASAYLDHTANSKPRVYISPNEVYFMHRTVQTNVDSVAPGGADRLRRLLEELGPAPAYTSDELSRARAGEIALELKVKNDNLSSGQSHEEALWVSAKRYVLALLKVQPGDNLLDAIKTPITPEHEEIWLRIRANETIAMDPRNPKSSPDLSQLEDITQLTFRELKARTIENIMQLERLGRLSRQDKFQGMLNAIAKDIRQKHRKRIQRQGEISTMESTLGVLSTKRKFLDSQLSSYNEYVEQSQTTMHKKSKKRLTIPFTTQFFHERSLAKKGMKPKFGSFVYSAAKLHQDGVLISIDQINPSRFEHIKFVISCDQVGCFDVSAQLLGAEVTAARVLYSDLLDAQFNGRTVYAIDGTAKVNLNLLLFLINKKFFV